VIGRELVRWGDVDRGRETTIFWSWRCFMIGAWVDPYPRERTICVGLGPASITFWRRR